MLSYTSIKYSIFMKLNKILGPSSACGKGDAAGFVSELKEFLSDKKSNVNETYNGMTTLYLIVQNISNGIYKEHHYQALEEVLVHSKLDVNKPSTAQNVSPLLLACQSGDARLISMLLAHPDIDLNFKGPKGITPFLMALQLKHENVAMTLLEHKKANEETWKAKTTEGYNALHLATQHNNPAIVKLLLAKMRDVDINISAPKLLHPISLACANESYGALEELLRSDKVVFPSKTKDHPLHFACEKQSLETLRLLLQSKKFDVNARSKDGFTPVQIACDLGNEDLVKVLLDYPETEDTLSAQGFCSLYIAASRGHTNIVRLLLNHPKIVEINIQDSVNFKTPLCSAVDYEQIEIVSLFLEDPRIDIFPSFHPPLHLVAKNPTIKKMLEDHIAAYPDKKAYADDVTSVSSQMQLIHDLHIFAKKISKKDANLYSEKVDEMLDTINKVEFGDDGDDASVKTMQSAIKAMDRALVEKGFHTSIFYKEVSSSSDDDPDMGAMTGPGGEKETFDNLFDASNLRKFAEEYSKSTQFCKDVIESLGKYEKQDADLKDFCGLVRSTSDISAIKRAINKSIPIDVIIAFLERNDEPSYQGFLRDFSSYKAGTFSAGMAGCRKDDATEHEEELKDKNPKIKDVKLPDYLDHKILKTLAKIESKQQVTTGELRKLIKALGSDFQYGDGEDGKSDTNSDNKFVIKCVPLGITTGTHDIHAGNKSWSKAGDPGRNQSLYNFFDHAGVFGKYLEEDSIPVVETEAAAAAGTYYSTDTDNDSSDYDDTDYGDIDAMARSIAGQTLDSIDFAG